jgi:hypothetical protein
MKQQSTGIFSILRDHWSTRYKKIQMIFVPRTESCIKPSDWLGSPMAEVESLWIHKVAVTNHFSLTIYS